ncbi:hypothetical protein BHE74_00022829 [Ensete ventricosum]|nr:hypothetical protein BHE74_00022829 [Ensete ventricosum]
MREDDSGCSAMMKKRRSRLRQRRAWLRLRRKKGAGRWQEQVRQRRAWPRWQAVGRRRKRKQQVAMVRTRLEARGEGSGCSFFGGGNEGSGRRGGWQRLGAEGRCSKGATVRLGAGSERRKGDDRDGRRRRWRKRRPRERREGKAAWVGVAGGSGREER